jgi:hypothetical protein
MSGASGRNWYRCHLGPHYPMCDVTASGIMEASMAAAGYLREFLYEGGIPPQYYIHPDPDMQQLLSCGNRLDAERYRCALERQRCCYGRLLRQYPEAEEVFGREEQFFTELPSTTRNFIRGCCLGIGSAERLMELSRLNNALVQEIRGNSRITIHTSAQVEDIRWDGDGFELDVQLPEGMRTLGFDQVVQAGWGHGLTLDLRLVNNLRRSAGMQPVSGEEFAGETLQRLRVVSLVRGVAQDDTITHSMIMSPKAASYAHLAPGIGLVEAPHMNVLAANKGLCPSEWDKALNGEDGQVHDKAKAMFEYCRPYFPFLQDAKCDSGFAAVVISGLDLGKRSTQTLRDTGLGQFGVTGYHSVSGMKLSNLPLAAVTTLRAVMEAEGGEWGVDLSEPAEVTLQRFASDRAMRIKPAQPSLIERMIDEERKGPLEAFRWEHAKLNL